MIEYPRDLPADHTREQRRVTEAHVRDHVASLAEPDDDPSRLRDRVRVEFRPQPGGGLSVVGLLDAELAAPYLRDDYDPDDEPRPPELAWTPGDQPGWDPYEPDPEVRP